MPAKESKFSVEKKVFADSETGREVWQVSPPECECVGAYMYINSFTPDERYLFYTSDRSGSIQLYRVELESGETTMVSDMPDSVYRGWNVHPEGKEVFFHSEGGWWAPGLRPRAR